MMLLILGFRIEQSSFAMGLSGLEDALAVLEKIIARARQGTRPIRGLTGAVGRLLEPVAGHIAIVVASRP